MVQWFVQKTNNVLSRDISYNIIFNNFRKKNIVSEWMAIFDFKMLSECGGQKKIRGENGVIRYIYNPQKIKFGLLAHLYNKSGPF